MTGRALGSTSRPIESIVGKARVGKKASDVTVLTDVSLGFDARGAQVDQIIVPIMFVVHGIIPSLCHGNRGQEKLRELGDIWGL